MKKILLITTVLTAVFSPRSVKAEVLTVDTNKTINTSASYDSFVVKSPNYFYFSGADSVLTLTESTASVVESGAYLVVGDKSEMFFQSLGRLTVNGSFFASGTPSLYAKLAPDGVTILFDEEKYKELPLPETTKISGNVDFYSYTQIGGVLSVLTATGEIKNRSEYSALEYATLLGNGTITEYEIPALLSITENVDLKGNLKFTQNSLLDITRKVTLSGTTVIEGAVNLKAEEIIVKEGFSGTLTGENPKIKSALTIEKNGIFSIASDKESTVLLTGNVSNAGAFTIGTGTADSKETLSLSDGSVFTNTGVLTVNSGSVLNGRVNYSDGTTIGTIKGSGTIRDLYVTENADTGTLFPSEQTKIINLYLDNAVNAVEMTGESIFFDSLQGNGTFKTAQDSVLSQKTLLLSGTVLDLNAKTVESSEADFSLSLKSGSVKNGTVEGKMTLQEGENALDAVQISDEIVNERDSSVTILNTVSGTTLTNKGTLDVQGTLEANVVHAGGSVKGTGTVSSLTVDEDILKLSNILTDAVTIQNLTLNTGREIIYDASSTANIRSLTGGGRLVLNKNNVTFNTFDVADSSVELGINKLTSSSTVDLSGSDLYISIQGSALSQHGQLKANSLTVDSNSKLILSVKNNIWAKGVTKELSLIDAGSFTDNFQLSESIRYKFERTATPGTYAITYLNSAADIAESGGGDKNIQEEAVVWDNFSGGIGTQKQVSSALFYLSNTEGKEKEYVQALASLSPNVKPIARIQSVNATVSAINTVSQRMNGRMNIGNAIRNNKRSQYNRRAGYRGRSGGDPLLTEGFWIQGLYNKTKFDVQNGFESTGSGFAGGFDKRTKNGLIGLALSIADLETKETAGRDTSANLHTGMIYGEYRSNNFFVNGILSGTYGSYTENKSVYNIKVTADYDIYIAGGQLTLGYDYRGFSPLLGARYFYAYQEDYQDSAGQEISSDALQTATVLSGVRFMPVFSPANNVFIIPELKVLAAYDFIEPSENKSVVSVGGSSYNVLEKQEDRLDRFGLETAAGITLDLGRFEASLRYEGSFKKDYESHTGMLELRYNFSF